MPDQGQTRARRSSGSETRQRRASVPVRYSDDERAEIYRRAERAGLTVSAYVRVQTLETPGPRAHRRPTIEHQVLARILGQLGKIGSSVNQLAAAANSGDVPPDPVIGRALTDLTQMRAAVLAALGRG